MGFKDVLYLAGAKVLEFESFGDYYGDWLALVEHNSSLAWVRGTYGPCVAWAAFGDGLGADDLHKNRYGAILMYDYIIYDPKPLTEEEKNEYKEKMKSMGEMYLNCKYNQADILKELNDTVSWDQFAKPMIKYVTEVGVKHNVP